MSGLESGRNVAFWPVKRSGGRVYLKIFYKSKSAGTFEENRLFFPHECENIPELGRKKDPEIERKIQRGCFKSAFEALISSSSGREILAPSYGNKNTHIRAFAAGPPVATPTFGEFSFSFETAAVRVRVRSGTAEAASRPALAASGSRT